MTQKSLSSETCLGYLSALQVHAFCRRRGIALATTRHRHFPSKAASRDQANDLTIRTCDPYLPAGIPMPLHCVSSSASTPRSAEFRKPHLCRLPLSGNALQRWNESILLSSPSLAFIQEASLRSFVDTLVSDSSYVARTSRRPWQRRPYMAHNRLRACVKFGGSSSATPVFLAPSEHVPQLHISSTAPLLPAKLKPRFS